MPLYSHRGNRTITWSGVITGRQFVHARHQPPGTFDLDHAEEEFSISCFGVRFYLDVDEARLASGSFPPYPTTVNRTAHIELHAVSTMAGDTTLSDSDSVDVAWQANGTDLDWDMAGTWTVTVDCEEVAVWELDVGFPSYGGAAIADQIYNAKAGVRLRTRVGGSIVMECDCGGLSVSLTRTITLANQVVISNYSANVTLEGQALGVGGACSASMNYGGLPIGASGVSWSNAYGSATGSAAISQAGSHGTPDYSRLSVTAAPTRRANLSVVVRAMHDAYPASLTLCIATRTGHTETPVVGGVASASISQAQYNATASIGPLIGARTDYGSTLDEWCDLSCWLKEESLIAAGEDSRNWRVMQRGWRFSSFSFLHNETHTHESGSWAAVGPAALTRTYSPAKSFQAYRYLRLAVSATVGAGPFTVVIGDKQWTHDRHGSLLQPNGSFDIDLCIPTNQTAESDTQDSRWPIDGAEGPYWGVGNVDELVLTGLTSGKTYTLTEVSQFWDEETHAQFLSPFDEWKSAASYVTSENQRFLLCMTDWKQSLEEPGIIRDDGPTYGHRTLTDLVNDINAVDSGVTRNPGFEATEHAFDLSGCGVALPALRDCLLNNSLPALFAEGNGAYYNDAGAWEYQF